jgi:hypothetical protein
MKRVKFLAASVILSALFFVLGGEASAGLLYVGRDITTLPSVGNFFGSVERKSSGYEARTLADGIGGGATMFSYAFVDANGKERVLAATTAAASPSNQINDMIRVYDPENWSEPLYEISGVNCYGVKGAAADGQYLYLTCEGKLGRVNGGGILKPLSGSVIKLDMANGYKEAARYDFPDNTDNKAGYGDQFRKGRAISVYDGKIYVLTMSYGRAADNNHAYESSEVFVFDKNNLTSYLNKVTLEESGVSNSWKYGRNATSWALYDGSFYIAADGGAPNGSSYGSVWKVDVNTLAVDKLFSIDKTSLASSPTRSLHGIAISDSGAVFLLGFTINADSTYKTALLSTTVANLKQKKTVLSVPTDQAVPNPADGTKGLPYVFYDKYDDTLWYVSNLQFNAYDGGGNYKQTLSASEHKALSNVLSLTALGYEEEKGGGGGNNGFVPEEEESGGGCSAGAAGIAGLFAAALLALAKKRRG